MKTISTLSRFLLKSLLVCGLVVAAGLAGVGIAVFVAFHAPDGSSGPARSSHETAQAGLESAPRLIPVSRLDMWQGRKIVMNVDASLAANRFVAAESSDKPQFAYADYPQEPADASAPALAPNVASGSAPPPLVSEPDGKSSAINPQPARLTDPGSHFIVDENTGRIIGIDGTAGAAAEARQLQQQQAVATAPHTREIRVALPVDAASSSELPPPKPNLYPAIRRALPVDAVADAPAAQPFNAASELADDHRPVFRAEPVTVVQSTKTQRHSFSLP